MGSLRAATGKPGEGIIINAADVLTRYIDLIGANIKAFYGDLATHTGRDTVSELLKTAGQLVGEGLQQLLITLRADGRFDTQRVELGDMHRQALAQ